MNHFKKTAVSIGALLAFSGAAHADCGSVSITEMNWSSASIVTSISKFLMEQGYGCDVSVVPSSTVPAVTSVAETGEPDIVTELWLASAPAYADLEAAGKVKTLTNVLSDGGVDAYWVPQYVVDEHPEAATIEGILANPEIVGGRFHNAPDGWGARVINDNIAAAWDFEGAGLEIFNHGSGETLASAIAAAYQDKQPIMAYYWAPTSILGKFDMVRVDLGEHVPEIHTCNASTDCETPGKSNFPAAQVITAVTTTFSDREPEIAALMENVQFTNAQMGSVLAWQEANGASSEEAAVYFLTTYKDVWGNWLNASAREKLSALLK